MFSDTVSIILLHAMEVGYLYLWFEYAVRTYAICRAVCMFSKKFRFARNAQTTLYFVNQQLYFIQVRPGIEFASGFVPPCLGSENKSMGWIRNGLGHSSPRRFSLWLRRVPIWYHITFKKWHSMDADNQNTAGKATTGRRRCRFENKHRLPRWNRYSMYFALASWPVAWIHFLRTIPTSSPGQAFDRQWTYRTAYIDTYSVLVIYIASWFKASVINNACLINKRQTC